jgi:hypothetical protein
VTTIGSPRTQRCRTRAVSYGAEICDEVAKYSNAKPPYLLLMPPAIPI